MLQFLISALLDFQPVAPRTDLVHLYDQPIDIKPIYENPARLSTEHSSFEGITNSQIDIQQDENVMADNSTQGECCNSFDTTKWNNLGHPGDIVCYNTRL